MNAVCRSTTQHGLSQEKGVWVILGGLQRRPRGWPQTSTTGPPRNPPYTDFCGSLRLSPLNGSVEIPFSPPILSHPETEPERVTSP